MSFKLYVIDLVRRDASCGKTCMIVTLSAGALVSFCRLIPTRMLFRSASTALLLPKFAAHHIRCGDLAIPV